MAKPEGAESDTALERGIAQFKERQFAAAVQSLNQARPEPGLRAAVLLMLGICHYRLGDLSRAEPLLRQVIREGDAEEQASARVFLGLLFQEQGAVDQARAEFGRVVGTPTLRDSARNLLQQNRPHRLLFTLLVSPEYDGNVPLTGYAAWSANPKASSDGDVLFLGAISVRPFSVGFTFGNTLSYRQQFQNMDYSLLLNSTWLGYSYLGQSDRFRVVATLNYALLGDSTLYLEGDARLSYRRRLWSKLGLALSYDGRYRDYRNASFLPLSGFIQALRTELVWGLAPQPVNAGIGYQAIREQTRTPTEQDITIEDYRAWAHGPTLFLRAGLHPRLELSFYGTYLQRIFDYVPGPELPLEQGIGREDHVLSGDLSLNLRFTDWLELFVGSTLIYNDSNKAPFKYFKPTAYLGLAVFLGLL